MEKIGETLTRLVSTTTLKATLDENQTLFRPRMAEAIADPSLPPESRKLALEEKLASLTRLSCMLMLQKKKFEIILEDLDKEALKIHDELLELEIPDIPPHAVIQFVDVVDQANQYFDFKELAKAVFHKHKPVPNPKEIFLTILDKQEILLSDFSEIGELQVTQAADAISSELYYERRRKKHTKWSKPKKDLALLDWIHNLVFKTRVKGYAMDHDPVEELKKMMKSRPHFFDNYFLTQQRPVECTETLTKEEALKEQETLTKKALNKYPHLVSLMNGKYKKACSEKHASTSARNIEEALNHKLMIILAPTCARNREALNENKFISTASEMDTKSKRPFVTTSDDMSPEKRKRL